MKKRNTIITFLFPIVFMASVPCACGSREVVNGAAGTAGGVVDAGADAGAVQGDGGRDAGAALDPTVYVHPLIGTDGNGNWGIGSTLPGPYAPFGMVKPGPDTLSLNPPMPSNYTHCAGYYYRDEYITGFSQNHFHGTGVPDYGNLGILPRIGRDTTKLTQLDFKTLYAKESEHAEPGYYKVALADGIKVEITASDRAAFYRFTYPKDQTGERCVIIDLGHTIPLTFVTEGHLTVGDDASFTGVIEAFGGLTAEFGGYTVFFKGEISPAPTSIGTWGDDLVFRDGKNGCAGSKNCGALVCWPDAAAAEVKMALSYVSVPKARANFDAEAKGRGFDAVRAETREKWRKVLAPFKVTGGIAEELAVFYTAVYHVFGMPTLQSDVDGSYMGFDKQPHAVDWGGRYYSDFSLWDTYRTEHPLLTLAYRPYQRDFVHSLLAQARTGGYFPKWSAANGETNCMVGTPADIVIGDSYLKGIDFPAAEALDFSMKTAREKMKPGGAYDGREGVEEYNAIGYLPDDRYPASVSKTQEYAMADNALCSMAEGLGRADDAALVCRNKINHRNLWNRTHGFFLARNADGTFPEEGTFDPEKISAGTEAASNRAYTEGDPWQYRWFAPHDAGWLIDQDGGARAFAQRLADFFERSKAEEAALTRGTEAWGSSRRYYWQGNEPDLHTAYLFSAAGRVDLACKYVRWAMRANFIDAPDGMPGNDDAGTESAWYIFSALGFYPIPGTDLYYVGCPLFPRAEVALEKGTLTVTADGPLDDTAVPVKVLWSGVELTKPALTWDQIKDGGALHFVMQ